MGCYAKLCHDNDEELERKRNGRRTYGTTNDLDKRDKRKWDVMRGKTCSVQ